MSLPLMGPGTHRSWLHRAEATTHHAWTAGIGRPPAALKQQVLPWRHRLGTSASPKRAGILQCNIACFGTVGFPPRLRWNSGEVVIALLASQGISDAQSLVRQGFDRKLSVR
ncbi:hypothetical protein HG421_17185 [Xanthomonas campestris pv. badrii]|uniref:Uncharacterized protein n=1 Tax=Xanthomonas campestris pv. badrii TaxID=149696 RepID=A0A7Z2VCS6_XANCA|nr:hypothetical protein [Xanthomonas campestris]QJD69266.1 hypothetical protein HG421_17185 [Xanthomonas campestris pv. badrii]